MHIPRALPWGVCRFQDYTSFNRTSELRASRPWIACLVWCNCHKLCHVDIDVVVLAACWWIITMNQGVFCANLLFPLTSEHPNGHNHFLVFMFLSVYIMFVRQLSDNWIHTILQLFWQCDSKFHYQYKARNLFSLPIVCIWLCYCAVMMNTM